MLLNRLCYLSVSHVNIPNFLTVCAATREISTELTTALRPFYFAVHPDLFGQHPLQRTVNEDSLKQLSAHIEMLYENKYQQNFVEHKNLQFYIRDNSQNSRDNFKLIQITLDRRIRDPKTLITKLLELCNLSTDYVRNIKTSAIKSTLGVDTVATTTTAAQTANYQAGKDYNYGSEFSGFQSQFYQAKNEEEKKNLLNNWMKANVDLANTRSEELAGLREEVLKLQQLLMARLQLQDIRYDCGWNFEHYRGCLKSLERLVNMHEEHMKILSGRVVVFAPFTGVSLEGHVMLFTGDVLNNWLEFLKNIPNHDAFLKKIPIYENTLSQVLRNIKIGRRKFMPQQKAVAYASHLLKVTTTLGDYLTFNKYPSNWPETLSDYEIVIESEAGPLMVNPSGQLIAPANCPGFILIDFITLNLKVAEERRQQYIAQITIEKELSERCVKVLQLQNLTKDETVTANKMIKTLDRLLLQDPAPFKNINLHITHYYSVLTDGIVCIPWNFER